MDNNVQAPKKVLNYLEKHEVGYEHARIKSEQVRRNLCTQFTPYSQYFKSAPISTYLLKPSIEALDEQITEQQIKLSTDRQLEYLKGSVKQHIDESIIKNILQQEEKHRGPVKNLKNRCVMGEDFLYYSSGCTLYVLHFGIQPQTITIKQRNKCLQTHTQILELVHYGSNILLRCFRCLVLYRCESGMIGWKWNSKHEITSVAVGRDSTTIFVSTYDGEVQRVLMVDGEQELWAENTHWPIKTILPINRRQCMVLNDHCVRVLDFRHCQQYNYVEVSDLGQDRLYSAVGFWSHTHHHHQFAISRKHSIHIYDIRNMTTSILQQTHKCDEAPPSCLQYFHRPQPMILAHSPHVMGSGLFVQPQTSTCRLLYDSGKVIKGLHPQSYGCVCVEGVYYVMQVDSGGGVSLQLLESNLNPISLTNPITINQLPIQSFQNTVLKHYLNHEPHKVVKYGQSSDDDSEQQQNAVLRKKGWYASLGQLYHKLHTKPTNKTTNLYNTQPTQQNQAQQSITKGDVMDEYTVNKELVGQLQQEWLHEIE